MHKQFAKWIDRLEINHEIVCKKIQPFEQNLFNENWISMDKKHQYDCKQKSRNSNRTISESLKRRKWRPLKTMVSFFDLKDLCDNEYVLNFNGRSSKYSPNMYNVRSVNIWREQKRAVWMHLQCLLNGWICMISWWWSTWCWLLIWCVMRHVRIQRSRSFRINIVFFVCTFPELWMVNGFIFLTYSSPTRMHYIVTKTILFSI